MPDVTQQTEGEFRHTLSVLERDRDSLLCVIRETRTQARRETIEASACRQGVEQARIDKWQHEIKKSAAELLAIEQKIGAVNKELRALRGAGKPPLRSLCQLPHEVATVQPSHETVRPNNGVVINLNPKAGRVLYLEFFRQLAIENTDPRLVEVWERDAHALVDEYRRTHGRQQEEARDNARK